MMLLIGPICLKYGDALDRAPEKDRTARFFGKRSRSGAYMPLPLAGRARRDACGDERLPFRHVRIWFMMLLIGPICLKYGDALDRAPEKDRTARFFGKRSRSGAYMPLPLAGRARRDACGDERLPFRHVRIWFMMLLMGLDLLEIRRHVLASPLGKLPRSG